MSCSKNSTMKDAKISKQILSERKSDQSWVTETKHEYNMNKESAESVEIVDQTEPSLEEITKMIEDHQHEIAQLKKRIAGAIMLSHRYEDTGHSKRAEKTLQMAGNLEKLIEPVAKKIASLEKAATYLQEANVSYNYCQGANNNQNFGNNYNNVTPQQYANASNVSIIPTQLPKYKMGTGSYHDIDEFICAFETILEASMLDIDQHWARLMPLCLSTDNIKWFKEEVNKNMNFKEFIKVFNKEFRSASEIRKAVDDLVLMKMNTSESLKVYCRRYQKAILKAEADEKQSVVVDRFIATLPDNIIIIIESAIKCKEISSVTVSNIIKYLAGFSIFAKEKNFDCKKHPSGRHSDSECLRHQNVNNQNRTPKKRNNEINNLKNNDQQKNNKKININSKNENNANSGNNKNIYCVYCKKAGHYSNKCPEKKLTDNNAVIKKTCINFGQADNENDYEIPILVAGKMVSAFLDTGASDSCISKKLADELKLDVQIITGEIGTVSKTLKIPRYGIARKVPITCGQYKGMINLEVVVDLEGAPILIGRPLMKLLGFTVCGLSTSYNNIVTVDDVQLDQIPDIIVEESIPLPELDLSRDKIMKRLDTIIKNNQDIDPKTPCPLECAVIRLPTPEGVSKYKRQYQLPFKAADKVTELVNSWLDDNVIGIAPSDTTFNTPIFIIPKKDEFGNKTDVRPCLDFRPLNEILPNDCFPLPKISDIFESLAGAQYFSTLDLKSAYHRLPIHPDDQHKTAFTWNNIQYIFKRAPFGIKTLPAKFQRIITMLFQDLKYALPYLDDIVVFSKTLEEHLNQLKIVIGRLNDAKLILNIPKCKFVHLEVKLLGFIINKFGHRIDDSQIADVESWPIPTSKKQIQHYLGFFNYFREHVPMMSTLTAPLDTLRNCDNVPKNWTASCDDAFNKLKHILKDCPILSFYDPSLELYIATDASNVGIGAALFQLEPITPDNPNPKKRYISFQARSLSKSERNYSATKRELLAVIFALRKFHRFTVTQ